MRMRARRRAALGVALAIALAGGARAQTDDGFHVTPGLGWSHGDHRVDLGVKFRARVESWDAFSDDADVFYGLKTRVKLAYSFRDQLVATVEGQQVQLLDMDATASGAERTYRNANEMHTEAGQLQLRQANLAWRPIPQVQLRAGRQDVTLGNEITYDEPDWSYLKTQRLGERLLGTVGFSHVERATDAMTGWFENDWLRVDAFGGRPTTGVFAVDRGMRPLHDVVFGGGQATLKRDAWLPSTELSLFGIGYDDDRPVEDGGMPHGVRVATIGASWLGLYDVGPGRADALVWVAGQWGRFAGDDHRAAAGIAELGYQLPEAFLSPWLRAGVNVASGDGDPSDGEHTTFFDVLPTNHLYSGFADQVEFQNLIDSFVQLRLTPHPTLGLNLFVHWFVLPSRDDARYAGTGAFDLKSFGYTAQATGGQSDVGLEYDAVATWQMHKTTTLEVGFCWLDGGDVFRDMPSRNTAFAYASIWFRY